MHPPSAGPRSAAPAWPPKKPAMLASAIHGMSRARPCSSTVTAIGVASTAAHSVHSGSATTAPGGGSPTSALTICRPTATPNGDREKHREGAGQPCRPGDEVPRRELGHRDRQREAGDDDDQAGEGGHRRRHAEPERRRQERGGRHQRRRDQLEQPLLQAQAAGGEPRAGRSGCRARSPPRCRRRRRRGGGTPRRTPRPRPSSRAAPRTAAAAARSPRCAPAPRTASAIRRRRRGRCRRCRRACRG